MKALTGVRVAALYIKNISIKLIILIVIIIITLIASYIDRSQLTCVYTNYISNVIPICILNLFHVNSHSHV